MLYFDNPARDSSLGYLIDGLTEEIITRLGQVERITVRQPSMVRRVQGRRDLSAAALGRQVGARYLVSGTLIRSGDRVRVTARMVRAPSGQQVWGESFTLSGDVLDLQERIASAVAGNVVGQLQPGERTGLAMRPTRNAAAYDLFLRARYWVAQASEESIRQGIGLYHRALAADSAFAQAWSGIAWAWAWLADAYEPPLEAYPEALHAAERALALDSTLASAYAIRGYAVGVLRRDLDAADRDLRRALALDSRSEDIGNLFGIMGLTTEARAREGLAVTERMLSADPFSPTLAWTRAALLYALRRYDDALRQSRQLNDLYPQFFYLDAFDGAALRELGRTGEALDAYRRAEGASGGRPLFGQGITYARLGRRAEAERVLAAIETRARDRYVAPTMIAGLRAALGNQDGAFAALEQALAMHDTMLQGMDLWPWLDPLRADPRYAAIRRRLFGP